MKPKWDERAYFMVQDKLLERMDDGLISWNEGVTDLAVLALIRATCSRSGALGKDPFDVSGAIAKWARVGGENVMNAAALTLAREGFKITLPDGTIETNAERGELDMTRLKHMYDEAACGGYEYSMSITPDTVAILRRAIHWLETYLWRRAMFRVQYEGMSTDAITAAIAERRTKAGHKGGMPNGAVIDAEEAVARFKAGEKALLPELKGEPLLVALTRSGGFGVHEITTRQILLVFKRAGHEAGFKPGSEGVNNLRRGTMVGLQKGAERAGFDPAMHAKKVVNHRQEGHSCREQVYEDTTATTDVMAFLCGRVPEPIESLKSLSNLCVIEVSKYRWYADVPKKDPVQKLLTHSDELKALRRAIETHEHRLSELEGVSKKKPTRKQQTELELVQKGMVVLRSEQKRLDKHLKVRSRDESIAPLRIGLIMKGGIDAAVMIGWSG